MTSTDFYRRKFLLSAAIPAMLVFLMWLVTAIEYLFEIDLKSLGIYPLHIRGLPGVILSPFIHSDIRHLLNNSLPVLLLGTGIFYFYSEVALKVTGWIFLLTGLLLWLFGREAWHIGASGLVYGFASFLFFSGIIRRFFRLVALSLLVVFIYGSMVWGMVPDFYQNVSWEAHMLGFISGILLSIIYRNEGPAPPVYSWMEEDDPEEEEENRDETEQNSK